MASGALALQAPEWENARANKNVMGRLGRTGTGMSGPLRGRRQTRRHKTQDSRLELALGWRPKRVGRREGALLTGRFLSGVLALPSPPSSVGNLCAFVPLCEDDSSGVPHGNPDESGLPYRCRGQLDAGADDNVMGRLAGTGTGMSLTPFTDRSGGRFLSCVSSSLASCVLRLVSAREAGSYNVGAVNFPTTLLRYGKSCFFRLTTPASSKT